MNIGYNQDFECWHRTGDVKKELYKARKKIIQKNFKKELNLAVSVPRSGGMGNSNTGNCARKVYNHPLFFAEQIIKKPRLRANSPRVRKTQRLITMVRNIWMVLRSCMKVNIDKLQAYCDEAAALYKELFPWYPMSPTLHKVLEHIGEILQYFPPTITSGMLTEEAGETANKDNHYFTEHHAPQHDLTARNLAVFTRFMIRGDPVVLSHLFPKKVVKSNAEAYPQEVLDMFEEVSTIYNAN